MKKVILILLVSLCTSNVYTSKLSKYLNKMDDKQKQQAAQQRQMEAQEMQQDMNFADFSFRLQQRYIDNQGQRCRDYEFRARSNPYKHGYMTVCDER